MTVIGTPGAIFCAGTTKLTGHHHHVIGLIEGFSELQQGIGQIGEIVGQQASDIALVDVRVPPPGR